MTVHYMRNHHSGNDGGSAMNAQTYAMPRYYGTVATWNPDKGFGFIRPETARSGLAK